MKIITNRFKQPADKRTVWCPNCQSELEITDADIRQVAGRNAVRCPCCHTHFPAMKEAQLVQAYYNK